VLLVDDREDKSLPRTLAVLGVPVEETRLEYGDACWEGKGPGDRPILIGIERKRITDVRDSLKTRRLSGHQVQGMIACYDYRYLLIEDNYRPTREGLLETFRGTGWVSIPGINYAQLEAFCASLEATCGVGLLRSGSLRETASIYAARYHWWQKPWDSHHSNQQIYAPGPHEAETRKASFVAHPAGLTERIAAQLPGVDQKAWAIAKEFTNTRSFLAFAADAYEKEWATLPGIGKDGAKTITKELNKPR
jgi:ERCC4-type nuclease